MKGYWLSPEKGGIGTFYLVVCERLSLGILAGRLYSTTETQKISQEKFHSTPRCITRVEKETLSHIIVVTPATIFGAPTFFLEFWLWTRNPPFNLWWIWDQNHICGIRARNVRTVSEFCLLLRNTSLFWVKVRILSSPSGFWWKRQDSEICVTFSLLTHILRHPPRNLHLLCPLECTPWPLFRPLEI